MGITKPGLDSPVPIEQGGTGANNLTDAQTNLGIGSGGAFASVSTEAELTTALANSERCIVVTASFFLTSDKTFLIDTFISICLGIELNCEDFAFIGLSKLILGGPGAFRYARTTATQPIQLGVGGELVTISHLTVINESTSSDTHIATFIRPQSFFDTRFELPNFARAGIRGSFLAPGEIQRCTIVGGGTSCEDYLIYTTGANSLVVKDVTILGTTHTDGIDIGSSTILQGLVDGLYLNQSAVSGTGVLNIRVNTARGIVSDQLNQGIEFNNIQLVEGCSTFNSALFGVFNSVTGIKTMINSCRGRLQINGSAAGSYLISNFIGSSLGFIHIGTPSQFYKFTNVEFGGSVTVEMDDAGFFNCTTGPFGGGGSTTININSGSNRVRVIGCGTDVAIVNSGTATVLLGNTTI